jgi:pantothenate synthetase
MLCKSLKKLVTGLMPTYTMAVLPVCAACSRNARLSPESRTNALSISQALRWAQQVVQQREVTSSAAVAAEVRQRIAAAGGEVDYVQVRPGAVAQQRTRCVCQTCC